MAKMILSSPEILGLILKKCRPDIFALPIPELAKSLKKEDILYPQEEASGLRSDLTNPKKVLPGVGKMIYDSLNLYVNPGEASYTVNVEVMHSFQYPIKRLAGKMYYYLANQIVAQKNDRSGFRNKEYENIRRVFSLWIFTGSPANFIYYPKDGGKLYSDDPDQKTIQLLKNELDNLVQIHIAGISENRRHSDIDLIQCLGHVFRSEAGMKSRINYLRKEGISVETIKSRFDAIPEPATMFNILEAYGRIATLQNLVNSQSEKIRKMEEEIRRLKLIDTETEGKD